ncbi:MAG: DUF4443 domain-containing protein [Nitrososphaerales archaeon]
MLSQLDEVVRTTYPGPSISFSMVDGIRAVMELGVDEIGREKLAKNLGIGNGAVRTLIKRLERLGLLEKGPHGCRLTKKGQGVFGILKTKLMVGEISGGPLSTDRYTKTLLIRGGANSVKMGLEQRDAAIREGATGATSLIFDSGRFVIPGGSKDCEQDFPSLLWQKLRKSLRPVDGDLIIVCSGRSKQISTRGAYSVAWTALRRVM